MNNPARPQFSTNEKRKRRNHLMVQLDSMACEL
jgi:hypothetical protein